MPDHAVAVAELAAANARSFGLEKAAYVLGLLHDLGKYDSRFQARLEGATQPVDHSTAGGKVLLDMVAGQDRTIAELIVYCILGHHAGLPDKHSEDASCFERRIQDYQGQLDPTWKSDLQLDMADLTPRDVLKTIQADPEHFRFHLSVVARFLFSCLVDADFKDTEAFYAKRENRQVDRNWSALQDLLPDFTARFNAYMAAKPSEGPVNALRRDILAHVLNKAAMAPGLFTLTVPTGGGKTLASLGFALDHAKAHGHRRIIYAIPFTSILDQVATIFGEVLGEEHILEHHSAIGEDEAKGGRGRRPPSSRDRLKLAMEDWAAPVVVTTNVQFFESLFAARTSRARKLHNIAGSIIILDEAQTIPRHLLKPCVRMLDSLARLLKCTIVLCTATQPALGKDGVDGQGGFPGGLDLAGRELAPDPERLALALRRNVIVHAAHPMNNDALIDALAGEPQALIIVNSRKHALELYRQAKEAGLEGLVHLTTRQCAAHRRKLLADVHVRLGPDQPQPCRVIATSLIEAGVDIDFPKVWRAEAGWDQVIQAAGRSNRHGRRPVENSIVTVFSAPDYPPPREIANLVGDAARALEVIDDGQSLEAISRYFREVYWRLGDRLDGKNKDKEIISRLKFEGGRTNFAFRTIAANFRLIESEMVPVIIRYNEAANKAVEELEVEAIPSGAIARKLQTFTVQIPAKARDLLLRNGHARFECEALRGDQFSVLQNRSLYTEETGLLWENADYLAEEDSLI